MEKRVQYTMDENVINKAKEILNEINEFFKENITISDLKKTIGPGQLNDVLEETISNSRKKMEEGTPLLEIYCNSATFTNFINKVIMPYLLKKRDMETENEYYRIDLIGYEKGVLDDHLIKKGRELGLTPYCWNFQYAFEHENVKGKWIDEAIKLAYVDCPCKIVVGYNRKLKKNESQEDFDRETLEYMLKCIKKSKPRNNGASYLIVLFGVRGKKTWEEIRYNGYVVDYEEGIISSLQS